MGRIKKTTSEKHDSTMSAFTATYVQSATSIALPSLPSHLALFPRQWPFPRGDLHHWIPLLDRFDHILELFVAEYGLRDGPQTKPLSTAILQRGDLQQSDKSDKSDQVEEEALLEQGYQSDGDRHLVQSVLDFSTLLLQNCSNRSIYSSNEFMDCLLNTTSLPLLKHTLRLSLCLAQRFWASKQRAHAMGTGYIPSLHLNLSRMDKLASPFAKTTSLTHYDAIAGKGKQKSNAAVRTYNSNDLSGLLRSQKLSDETQQQLGDISVTYYGEPDDSSKTAESPRSAPSSPSLGRRATQQSQALQQGTSADESVPPDQTSRRTSHWNTSAKVLSVPGSKVISTSPEAVLADNLHRIPTENRYDLLHQVHIAKGIYGTQEDLRELISLRILAVTILGYTYSDSTFHSRIGSADSEQPKDYQLAYQLADILQPASDGTDSIPREVSVLALNALEALTKVKSKTNDVAAALNIGVSHGILFYVLRKVMASLETDEFDPVVSEWREAVLTIVISLAQAHSSYNRYSEQMVAAGIVGIYTQPLTLRTKEAERTWLDIMNFFDTFINNGVRDSFQAMMNEKGFDILAEALLYLVDSALEQVREGDGLRKDYETSITEYKISFFKQQSLRMVLKFILHLFGHNPTNQGRHIRNLIDSPQVLNGLKTILANGKTFGSNVWIASVNIIVNFIHSEPTSYNIIHEAGLSAAILEAIAPSDVEGVPDPRGILPVAETMRDIPQAFGAICLNEAGMKLFEKSQALNTYLRIFTSLEHVNALENDSTCAVQIGQLFDELVRHHPELKDQVHNSVMQMVKTVIAHCQDRAERQGAGAKLWIDRPSVGKVAVAGGKAALSGTHFEAGALDRVVPDSDDFFEDQVESDAIIRGRTSGRSTSDVISVLSKFLQGYLGNNSMLTKFCVEGGVSYLLDLLECPCNPWNTNDLSTYDELLRVFTMIVDHKAHLVLPSLVYRTRQALDFLEPLLNFQGYDAYFEPLTRFDSKTGIPEDAVSRAQQGTLVVKGLLVVQVMISILSDTLQSPALHSSRSTQHSSFSLVNLTDYYVDIVEKLGRLDTFCSWEKILLDERLPEEWKQYIKDFSASSKSPHTDVLLSGPPVGNGNSFRSENPSAEKPDSSSDPSIALDLAKKYPAEYKNATILRSLLGSITVSITSTYQQLGKALYTKSRSLMEAQQRQNATLVAEQLAKSAIAQLDAKTPIASLLPINRIKFETSVLPSIVRMLIDKRSVRSNQPDVLLLVLNQFCLQGGLKELSKYLHKYVTELSKVTDKATLSDYDTETPYLVASSELILDLFAKITSAKIVQDSQQHHALQTASNGDASNVFDSSQLLVEVRDAAITAIKELWRPEGTDVLTTLFDTEVTRSVIATLKSTLEADGESRAYSKKSKNKRPQFVRKKWVMRHPEDINILREEGYDKALAQEAAYRCNENVTTAREYCAIRNNKEIKAVERLPPPSEDLDPQADTQTAKPSGANATPSVDMEGVEEDEPNSVSDDIMSDEGDPMESLILNPSSLLHGLASRDSASLGIDLATDAGSTTGGGEESSATPAPKTATSPPGTATDTVYVEDLDEKRSEIRSNLVDRCLDILNAHTELTFDVADLITAATSGSKDDANDLKESIGETLTSTLISLKDNAATEHKKLAAIAHLLALVLQDKEFFDVTVGTLQTNFGELIGLLGVPSNTNIEDCAGYLGNVLLLVEKVLSEDEQPQQIQWTPPPAEAPTQEPPPIELAPPLVDLEVKQTVLSAILELLPRVSKNELLALSITRVLVILTRRRQIAKRLAEKQNLGRLFLMAKQLAGMSNERLQSAFMIVLRHMVEDEDTIRQIMRTEIQLAFENSRSSRPMDTSAYVRHLYHLVLRDPDIFVEVTNEKVQLARLDSSHRAQGLTLKKEDKPKPVTNTDEAESSTSRAVQSTEKAEEDLVRQPLERVKTSEMKPPTVEHPDGVIQFLLRELLNYRDVEDQEGQPSRSNKTPEPTTTDSPTTSDVEMSDATPPPGALPTPSPSLLPQSSGRSDRPIFKTEDHPIFVYRCHLLQCLVELLTSYKRAKIEFINFSPRADAPSATPSKPRSGILNYLLTTLLPTGTLLHPEGVEARKKSSTANWALSVIVALCAKTLERAVKLPADRTFEEEPDLTFVRKFVLEQILKALNSAMHSTEPLDMRYSRFLGLSDLLNRMLTSKPNFVNNSMNPDMVQMSAQELGRLMYEKNFVSALTAAIAEIDLNFPSAKRAVKYILRPLKMLTDIAVELSLSSDSAFTGTTDDDEISSATSLSEEENERDATPDIFRNSTLGQFEAGREDDSESSEGDEDEEYYGDDYDEDEMDYEEDVPRDHGEVHSDDDVDTDGMGPIEGVPGDVDMGVELLMDGDSEDGSHDNSSDDESDTSSSSEDGDEDEEDDEVEILDEITGDDENDSGAEGHGDDEDDWEDEDDDDDDDFARTLAADRRTVVRGMPGNPLNNFVHVMDGEGESDIMERLESAGIPLEMDMDPADYFDDEMPPEEDEDEEIEYEEEEIVYEPEQEFEEGDEDDEYDDEWGYGPPPPSLLRRHAYAGPGSMHISNEPWSDTYVHRSHRPGGRANDDGTNPLLQRSEARSSPGFPGRPLSDAAIFDFLGSRPHRSALLHSDHSMPSFVVDFIQGVAPRGGSVSIVDGFGMVHTSDAVNAGLPPPPFSFTTGGFNFTPPFRRNLPRSLGGLLRLPHTGLGQRPPTHDPQMAIQFTPAPTITRWQDEARMLFSQAYGEVATRVVNSILRLLTPPAMEAKRLKDKADAEKREAEKKLEDERREKEENERKEREEREKKEREEQEAREQEEAAQRAAEAGTAQEATAPMEGVEASSPAQQPDAEATENAAGTDTRERITAMVRGQQVDITDLGIDPDFLQEIPEDMRDDVIMAQLQSRLEQRPDRPAQPAAAVTPVSEPIDREFLNALPADIQQELLRAEASERNRRHQDAARNARAAAGNTTAQPEEMTSLDFMASLDPNLRRSVLMEADEALLDALPASIRAEAEHLLGSRRAHRRIGDDPPMRRGARSMRPPPELQAPAKRHVVQILDKAGVATLLRLMFIHLSGSAKSTMLGILGDITRNPQNRAEVISILLSILQDGSSDGPALDKSFTQLSLRAKQMSGPKTPQPLRRTLTGSQVPPPNTDATPLTIVQQCLAALTSLAEDNPRISSFFLTEHETITSQRNKTPKKGKGKENKAQRYPINALLTLLDRRTIIENSTVMEHLAVLLVKITEPLKAFLRRAKEEEKKVGGQQAEGEQTGTEQTEVQATSTPDDPAPDAATDVAMAEGTSTTPTTDPEGKKEKPATEGSKKARDTPPPDIPEENLCLVVNIIAARECSGKTFQNTLDIINYLSAVPGARDIFGRELVRRAQDLGVDVLADLQGLPAQIRDAQSSTEMQGRALAAFSPASSHQNKLLRVLLALDYIFDPKRVNERLPIVSSNGLPPQARDDLISSLYNDATFVKLWTILSDCLTAIRERGGMNNVATILQPLVEAFMVVCKNTTSKEVTVTATQEVNVSSPPPETRLEGLFFTFTEEHRKILNDLVRQNPKLMSGTFDVLVKNSKVLEFDNKRNFFNKRLHQRNAHERHSQPTLQLNVRRSEVFMDSFKALFFKKPEEIKYGKFNIRFAREEGVDAGGVTREWFAAISRQMFNPNYALFNPVAADRTTFHPNPLSVINEQHLTFFKFIGRIIGKALYENRVLDCHFSRAVYKRILGKPVSLKDMETLDLDYYKSLVWMLENDITDIAFETFSTEVDRFGETEIVDLKPNGRNIPVTEENKHEYVRLVVEQRLTKSVEEQLEHFLMGFRDIVPLELISIFNEQELELLISGLPDIDVDDWKNNTDYQNYSATSPQVQWFWRAVRSFDKEEQAKLLQFVTGTSKVPLNGFKELEGMNGFSKFNIHRDFGNKDRLPSSHTCFNQLDLPEYDSYEILRKQIYTAMTVGSDHFGFA